MYLARSFPLIKPTSLHIPSGYEPFDASRVLHTRDGFRGSLRQWDHNCSTALTRRTKSLAPYCHHNLFGGKDASDQIAGTILPPSIRCGHHHEMTTSPDQQIRSNAGIIHVTSADRVAVRAPTE